MTQHECVQLDHVLQIYHVGYHKGHRPSSIREPPVETATSITVRDDPPAPSTLIEAAADEAVAMTAAPAARTDADVSGGEQSDDVHKDEEEPDQPRAGGRTSRARATTSAAARWAGASAQDGSDVHLDSDSATDELPDKDNHSGRNCRGRIATTAARTHLPHRRLGTGRHARSAASPAYAEVTCSSSSSSSSEDEKGCDDQVSFSTAAAPHGGRAVQNGRLRRGRLSIAHIVSVSLSPFVSSLYMLCSLRESFLCT